MEYSGHPSKVTGAEIPSDFLSEYLHLTLLGWQEYTKL